MYKKLLIFIPHIGGGGVEKNFFILSNFLIKKIKDVSIITVNKEFKKKLNKKIKFISPKSNQFKNSYIYVKYIVSLYLLIKTLINDKNYVLLTFQGNWYSILIAKIFGIKVITRSNTSPIGWSKNVFKNFLYKFFLYLSDEVIVNSFEFQKIMKKKFNINAKCIYNPLNKNEIIKKSKKKVNFNFFKKTNALKLITFGRLTDQKNQILLLKAIFKLKNKIPIRLLIAGDGPEKINIKSFIDDNNLKRNVRFLNFLENPYPYLKLANIFVLTSNYEGLPNVLLESQCLKKIIISSNCSSGPSDILKNGKYGFLFKTRNQDDLVKKILFIYKNRNIAFKKSKIGFNHLNRFDQNKNLLKYYHLLSRYILK